MDGLIDAYDNNVVISGLIPIDTDGDYIPDYLDTDSDNDALNDTMEAGYIAATSNNDTDKDGLLDVYDDVETIGSLFDVNDDQNNGASDLPNLDTTTTPEVDFREIKDSDGDGVTDSVDLDDDNDGIPDILEGGTINCLETVILSGDASGNIYEVNVNTGATSLKTSSPYVSGIVNALAANADNNLIYYGDTVFVYYYNQVTNTHGLVGDLGSQITGNLESGGATYYEGNLYIATEPSGGGDHIEIYRVPLAADGLSFSGSAVALGPRVRGGYGDFVISGEGTAGRLYGSTTVGIWTFDIGTEDFTWLIYNGSTYQMAVTFNGDLWTGLGTSLQRMDLSGNLIGTARTIPATSTDMTGPFNCPQIDPDLDTDNDGIPNALDLDSDNDGIPDIVEAGGIDNNGDGRVDGLNNDGTFPALTDTDGDGWLDIYDSNSSDPVFSSTPQILTLKDSDADGIPDFLDLDADNDGIPDLVESGGVDNDGDGRVDITTDADNDGFADVYDSDDDGIGGIEDTTDPLLMTDDTDADGVIDTWFDGSGNNENLDGDGIPNAYDLDADQDGIPDLIEAGGVDNNGDGRTDLSADVDSDGLVDVYDMDNDDGPGTGSMEDGSALVRTDGTDSDNNGKPNEAGFSWEHGNNENLDTDSDGYPDYLDLDADNDGVPDLIEAWGIDIDGNGIVDNARATDTDQDGLVDLYDANASDGPGGDGTNGSALLQTTGTDTNSDGLADGDGTISLQNGAGSTLIDQDGDGYPNHLDLDADNDGILDVVEVGATDADNDGRIDNAVGNNGYVNSYDPADSGTPRLLALADGSYVLGSSSNPGAYADRDEDGVPDFIDLDADNDGIFDYIEGQATGTNLTNTYVSPNTTYDSNGVPTNFSSYQNYDNTNSVNNAATYGITPYNHDGTDLPDYLDTDSDNDLDPDIDEAWDSSVDGNGVADVNCTTDADKDGLLDCFDSSDADHLIKDVSTNPPVDNGYEAGQGNGNTGSSAISALDGSTVLAYDVFPNNQGDNSNYQPDWRDAGCNVGASLNYPVTDTDAIYSGGTHSLNPSVTNGTIRASDFCTGTYEAGWTYYFDPLNSNKILFAINHGSNVTPIDFIELRRDDSSDREVTNGGAGTGYFVMPRDFTLATVNDAALLQSDGVSPATIDIRFYFDPTDSTDMISAGNSFGSSNGASLGTVEWFRTTNQFDNADIAASTGLVGQSGYSTINPAAYGSEGGLHYAQFDGLNSVASFGMGVGASPSLPVEWLDFSVSLQGNDARINWTTSQEVNNDFFSVERSVDGMLFAEVDRVKGVGNSTEMNHYESLDYGVRQLDTEKMYYRIRQVDFDGGYSYSNVLELSEALTQNNRLTVYPVPVKESLFLEWELFSENNTPSSLRIINSLGKEIFKRSIINYSDLKIGVQDWPAGYYYVIIVTGDQYQLSHKILKE
ncbi:MAG: T9SS type A sorting domain-containing protein [Bacteroidia bacterium]